MTDSIKMYPPKPDRVYLFGTCLIDIFYPEAGLAALSLLEREGIDVHFPDDQTCCGQPAYTSGRMDEARDVARRQLDLFPEPWPILVPSGSCGGMIAKHYPHLFEGTDDAARAEDIAARTFELTDFLLNVCHVRLEDKGEPVQVAMHTSCSARREMGLAEVGPQLLGQLSGVTLKEQAHAAECCGFGGSFAVRHPEVSGAMVQDKVAALSETGVQHFVTSDCGCLMNIDGCAQKQGAKLRGEHLLSFLWQRTREDRTHD
ncbi:(Fe-S)-binding protein [Saccharospirillum salsuginis]|uniref:Fe-S oxidoreductase n=1 Tax=Saccharospirillum salsuginis TaxID=418750 RepID=A0A918KJ00_9GAMM|nr:(Fe-S)-binding protein [Saccharospirillum salsuginis]GGX65195.1 Fe-S oxidoreductase [Saccharospirillum salsuginis]